MTSRLAAPVRARRPHAGTPRCVVIRPRLHRAVDVGPKSGCPASRDPRLEHAAVPGLQLDERSLRATAASFTSSNVIPSVVA